MDRSCGPMNKNRIKGVADQGEWARDREALVTKGRWRRSGDRAAKGCVLTWGDLGGWPRSRSFLSTKATVPPVSRTWRPVRNTIPIHLCREFLQSRYHGFRRNHERQGMRLCLRASGVGCGLRNSFAITILAADH